MIAIRIDHFFAKSSSFRTYTYFIRMFFFTKYVNSINVSKIIYNCLYIRVCEIREIYECYHCVTGGWRSKLFKFFFFFSGYYVLIIDELQQLIRCELL